MVSRNLLIIKYDIRFNPMNNELAEELLKALECNKMVKKIELPTNVRLDLR